MNLHSRAENDITLAVFVIGLGAMLPSTGVAQDLPDKGVYCLSEICLGDTLDRLLGLELQSSGRSGFSNELLRRLANEEVACDALIGGMGTGYLVRGNVKIEVTSSNFVTRPEDRPRRAYRVGSIKQVYPGGYTRTNAIEAIEAAKRRWPVLGEVVEYQNQLYARSTRDGFNFRVIYGYFEGFDGQGLGNAKQGLQIRISFDAWRGRYGPDVQAEYEAQPECSQSRPQTPRF